MRKREKEVLNTLLSFITEKQSSWEKLQAETRPIFIYGMGDGAEKIMRGKSPFRLPAFLQAMNSCEAIRLQAIKCGSFPRSKHR